MTSALPGLSRPVLDPGPWSLVPVPVPPPGPAEGPCGTSGFRPQTQFVSAFKQSPRREDDISTVTAAMSATFAPGTDTVEDLRLSYGGMAATTVMAAKTANRLVGR